VITLSDFGGNLSNFVVKEVLKEVEVNFEFEFDFVYLGG